MKKLFTLKSFCLVESKHSQHSTWTFEDVFDFVAQSTLKKFLINISIGTITNSLTPKAFLFESDLFWSIPEPFADKFFLVWYDQFMYNNKCLYVAHLLCCKRCSRKLIQTKTACGRVKYGKIEIKITYFVIWSFSKKFILADFQIPVKPFWCLCLHRTQIWRRMSANIFCQIACTFWENQKKSKNCRFWFSWSNFAVCQTPVKQFWCHSSRSSTLGVKWLC